MIYNFDKVVFIHIQKTAGTSLLETLRPYFKKQAVLDHGQFTDVPKADLDRYRFITGHFGYDYIEDLPGKNLTFTFLRDPVERILSFYYFCRKRNPEQYEIYKMAAELPLLDFVRSVHPLIRSHIQDTQTWQIARSWFPNVREQLAHLSSDEILEMAKTHLRELSLVGLTENYENDTQRVYRALGLANVFPLTKNVTTQRLRREEVTSEVLEAIRQRVPLDELLYQYAKEKLSGKKEAVPKSGPIDFGASAELNKIRAIAFYLPQFHQVQENDEWWGAGFTEWTNVKRAQPLFEGHDQPRRPGGFGYYDLTDPSIMEAQAALAREYGIYGFCFYHYRFGKGRSLLEMPVVNLLKSSTPDFPFCLCWANESWTRTWDGGEQHVLMEQTYSEEDAATFAEELIAYFKDPRYIRIGGKPLLVVYRSHQLPDASHYVNIWRTIWRERGCGEIYLCAALTGGEQNPVEHGFDAGVEFPPHRGIFRIPSPIQIEGTAENGFQGVAYDYRDWVSLHISAPDPSFTVFRTLMMAWDNTARRGNRSKIFLNCTPAIYEAWMSHTVQHTLRARVPEERIIFINAWNEWAEGTYLEPDEKYGLDYLKATRAALQGKSRGEQIIDELHEANGDLATLLREAQTYSTSLHDFLKPMCFSVSKSQTNNVFELVRQVNEKLKDKRKSYNEMRRKRDRMKDDFKEQQKFFVWKFIKPIFNIERGIRKRLGKKVPK